MGRVKWSKPWEAERGLSPGMQNPWYHLAAAILKRAATQAEGGDWEAADWLGSEAGALIAEAVGFDRRRILTMAGQWAANARGKIIVCIYPEVESERQS